MLRAKVFFKSFDMFFVPEAQRILAGGEGAAATTGMRAIGHRTPAGAQDKPLPQIPLVIFDAASVQKFQILFLKCFHAVMFFLIFDVILYRIYL
jgi:hypothetical protein